MGKTPQSTTQRAKQPYFDSRAYGPRTTWTGSQSTRYLERTHPLKRPHQDLQKTNSGHASIINPTSVQPVTFMNDMISSPQHGPNQVTQLIFSQQLSPLHGFQQTAYQFLPAVFAPQNVTYTQEAVPPDFCNQ